MDKSFFIVSDDEGDPENDDNKEFERFNIMEKVIPEINSKDESSSLNNVDLAAEVDGALDALRSVLVAENGKCSQRSRDAKPSHSRKGKQEKGKEHYGHMEQGHI